MTDAIRILIVDDHTIVRSGFRLLLEQIEGFDVVGEAEDGAAALDLIESTSPNVVITDLAMPGIAGLELVSRIKAGWPDIACILLSMHKSAQYVKSALKAGAVGYLLKDSAGSEVEVAVRAVVRGESYLSPAASRPVIDDFVSPPAPANSVALLTDRQIEVVKQMAEGFSTKEIAANLGLSPKTVETHRAQLMKRLDIYDVAGLVRFAIREGLVNLD